MNQKLKTFLKKSLLLLLLIFGSIEAVFRFSTYRKHEIETSYYATIIEKHGRLKSLKSPKIVMLAGSNFAYGINSEMIESAFKKPVVNMAIHYDFGSKFMLNQVENELKTGDLLILGFEYIIDSDGKTNDKIQLSNFYPEANQWFEYKDVSSYFGENFKLRISTLKIILNQLFSKPLPISTVEDKSSMFFRKAINSHGDLISHLNNPPLKTIPRGVINDKKSLAEPINDINLFYEKVRRKGVKVLYVFPCYAASSYEFDKEIIQKLTTEIRTKGNFPILGKPEDFVYPDSLMQDMVFHLNKNGRDIRTQKIIDLVKSHE